MPLLALRVVAPLPFVSKKLVAKTAAKSADKIADKSAVLIAAKFATAPVNNPSVAVVAFTAALRNIYYPPCSFLELRIRIELYLRNSPSSGIPCQPHSRAIPFPKILDVFGHFWRCRSYYTLFLWLCQEVEQKFFAKIEKIFYVKVLTIPCPFRGRKNAPFFRVKIH